MKEEGSHGPCEEDRARSPRTELWEHRCVRGEQSRIGEERVSNILYLYCGRKKDDQVKSPHVTLVTEPVANTRMILASRILIPGMFLARYTLAVQDC